MKKYILKIGLFLIIFGAVFNACRQELFDKNTSEPVLTVEEAQAWYETSQPEFLLLKSGNSGKKTKVASPDWKGAFASKNDKVEVVETHIVTEGGFGFATENAYNQWKNTDNAGYITSVTRLVVMKYRKTGEMVSFLMTIVGDKEYLETKQFEMWDNTYLTKDKDFSGLVLFHSTEGAFVNGWRYSNGKVTHTVNVNFDEKAGISLKSGSYDCDIYDIYGWFMDCTINSWNVTSGEVSVYNIETECGAPYVEHIGIVYQCTYVDGGSGGGGNYQSTPIADRIINNYNNFDASQKDKLENVLKGYKGQNCGSNAIFNAISNSNFKFDVKIKSDLAHSAGYDSGNNTMYFKNSDAISYSSINEEMAHVFQDVYYSGSERYSSTGRVNIEFEAKLTIDLSSLGCCTIFRSAPSDIVTSYQNWIRKIQANSYYIDDTEYTSWLNKFYQYHPEYRSNYSSDLTEPHALKSISSQFDCN